MMIISFTTRALGIAAAALLLSGCARDLCGPPGFEKFTCDSWAAHERAKALGYDLSPKPRPIEVIVVGTIQ